jgi:hypothetical protein
LVIKQAEFNEKYGRQAEFNHGFHAHAKPGLMAT